MLGDFSLSVLAARVQSRTFASSPSWSNHTSVRVIKHESRIVNEFKYQLSTPKPSVPSFFGMNMIGDIHPVWACFKPSISRILSIYCFSSSPPYGQAWWEAECIGQSFHCSSLIQFPAALNHRKWPSHIIPSCASISKNLWRWATYPLGTCDLSRYFKSPFPSDSSTALCLSTWSLRGPGGLLWAACTKLDELHLVEARHLHSVIHGSSSRVCMMHIGALDAEEKITNLCIFTGFAVRFANFNIDVEWLAGQDAYQILGSHGTSLIKNVWWDSIIVRLSPRKPTCTAAGQLAGIMILREHNTVPLCLGAAVGYCMYLNFFCFGGYPISCPLRR